jgi:hypothetical protein
VIMSTSAMHVATISGTTFSIFLRIV